MLYIYLHLSSKLYGHAHTLIYMQYKLYCSGCQQYPTSECKRRNCIGVETTPVRFQTKCQLDHKAYTCIVIKILFIINKAIEGDHSSYQCFHLQSVTLYYYLNISWRFILCASLSWVCVGKNQFVVGNVGSTNSVEGLSFMGNYLIMKQPQQIWL